MISDKYKFIFVHIPKTGGQSIFKLFHPYKKNWWRHYEAGVTHEEVYTTDVVDSHFCWSVVRNPWSRIVSEYVWGMRWYLRPRNKKQPQMSFSDFVKSFNSYDEIGYPESEKSHLWLQTECIERAVGSLDAMDFICRLENYQSDFDTVCEKLNIPKRKLPKSNSTSRGTYKPHKLYDHYTCLLYTSPSPRDLSTSRMPSSA